MRITLNRVDQSGVYALSQGITSDQIKVLLLDGYVVSEERFVFVKGDTEVDIFDATVDSVVIAVVK